MGIVYKQILINAKLQIGKRDHLNGRSPLKMRWSALDFSAIEQEEKEDEVRRRLQLNGHLHLIPRLRISGAVSLFSMCASLACTESNLPSFFIPVYHIILGVFY